MAKKRPERLVAVPGFTLTQYRPVGDIQRRK